MVQWVVNDHLRLLFIILAQLPKLEKMNTNIEMNWRLSFGRFSFFGFSIQSKNDLMLDLNYQQKYLDIMDGVKRCMTQLKVSLRGLKWNKN